MKQNNKKGMNAAKLMKHRAAKGRGGQQKQHDGLDRSSPDTIASLVDAWLQRLKERNYSERTLSMNRGALRQFLEWSEQRDLRRPEQFTKTHLESFQRFLWRWKKTNGEPLGISTQRQRIGAIQRLFAHLCRQNYLPANPASELELPRMKQKALPKGLNREELSTLLNVPDVTDLLGVRDRAVLETLYASALRRSELINLDLQDVDLQACTLHIREGKGGKHRLLPIGRTAVRWLQQYLQQTRPELLLNHTQKALFISGYGERLSTGYLGNWMKKTLRAAGIEKSGCCHLLRHTCATHMLENGADIRLIQQFLGHTSLDTTSIYTQVAITHLQQVYNLTHPSACK
jgi:integrase/recombinase XerD